MEKLCRNCNTELIVGKDSPNWYLSHQRYYNYICRTCSRLRTKIYLEGHEDVRKAMRARAYKKGRAKQRDNIPSEMFRSAKKRAHKACIPFDLTLDDLVIPDICPILGIPLFKGTSKLRDNSPSLDRIDPKLGYIRGNIQIISTRANRAKSNLTGDELLRLGLWLVYGVHSMMEITLSVTAM